jgi:DNA invertase Pin-like site-specific DNA recombinase
MSLGQYLVGVSVTLVLLLCVVAALLIRQVDSFGRHRTCADAFMIGIMAQVAQWEREQISKRTKAALQIAKERGRSLAGDRGNLAALSSHGANSSAVRRSASAKHRASEVLPHVQQARAEGFRTYRSIAAYLNRRGIRTARGKGGGPASVRRLNPVV